MLSGKENHDNSPKICPSNHYESITCKERNVTSPSREGPTVGISSTVNFMVIMNTKKCSQEKQKQKTHHESSPKSCPSNHVHTLNDFAMFVH